MAYHATWILLLLTGATALIFEQNVYQVDKPASDYYFIAPDLFRQNSFVFATTNKTGEPPLVLRVDVVTIDWNLTYTQCSLTLRANINAASVGLNSVIRLSTNKILLETYEKIKSSNRYSTLVFLDMESCKITFPLPLQLSDKNIIHHTRYDNQFVLFTADKNVCKNIADKCLINYRGGFYTVEPFKVNLVWPSLRIERTFTDNLCLVHGLNGSGGYQVELYDLYNRTSKKLISLPYIEAMQIITSDLAICWILDSSQAKTTVYCSQFDQQGVLIFSSTINYDKQVKLIFLHSIRKGKIILLTGRERPGSSSWEISITSIESNNQARPSNDHRINTACTGSITKMVFDARINNMIEIEYLCLDYNNKFRYTTISMVDK